MNDHSCTPTRRAFLSGAGAAAVLSAMSTLRHNRCPAQTVRSDAADLPPISVFTKPFNSLNFSQLASEIAAAGFDAIEAPIRSGGHIEANQIEQQLPRLVNALKQRGLSIAIMASDINDPDDPQTERTLKAAAASGVPRYRLKYFQYVAGRSIKQQIANWKARLADLAALNQQIGIQGLYQNHAGPRYFGAPIWDLAEALSDINPDHLGVAYDIRHATVEGGMSWPVTMRRIAPHMRMLYVKDFQWQNGKVVNVPLGEGLVDPKFFKKLTETGFTGPVSLHEEYIDHRDPALVPDHLKAIRTDLKVLKTWLG